MPASSLSHKSPYYCLFNQPPNYLKLRSFGCLCYPWLRPYSSHKLDSRYRPCIFVGYSSSQSAYYCLDPITHRIYISRHVKFVENEFPYGTLSSKTHIQSYPNPDAWCPITLPIVNSVEPNDQQVAQPISPLASFTSSESETESSARSSSLPMPSSTSHMPLSTSTSSPHSSDTIISLSTATTNIQSPPSASQPPSPTPTTRTIITRAKNNISKPNPKYANSTTIQSKPIEPTTVAQALKDPLWCQAMTDELKALHNQGTWDLVPPDSSQNLIKCRWVFRIKYKPDGTIERYRARLVAKGFQQRPGIDYSDTFSPVAKPATIRTLLSLAVANNWSLRQLDINNAFLNGTLNEQVYMTQPPGFPNAAFPSYVCKLRKAIYGLKQAPRAWYMELTKFLLNSGFTRSIADSSLFINNQHSAPIYLVVYVDDIILTGPDSHALNKFVAHIAGRFALKDLGPLTYFLGVEVIPHTQGLFLSQKKYVVDLLKRTNMLDAKPVSTPMVPDSSLTLHSGTLIDNPTDYRAAVGGLQYLTLTRPDVAFTVNKLSQYMHNPRTTHWAALKRLLRYLAGSG